MKLERLNLWMALGIALLVLLPILALLQYRWIGQVSQSEGEHMQADLHSATTQFEQDFDQEIVRGCVAFQMDFATLSERDWQKYGSRYQDWARTASYPNLIRNLYFVEVAGAGELRFLRWNRTEERFDPIEWPAAYTELRNGLEALSEGRRFREVQPAMRPFGWTVLDEIPAVALPLFRFPARPPFPRPNQPPPEGAPPPRPSLIGCSILELNLEFLQHELLPELARKHFATPGGFAYQVAVASKSDPNKIIYRSDPKFSSNLFSSADATANILQLRPVDFRRFTAERLGPGGLGGPAGRGGVLGGPPNPLAPGSGHWRLFVKHPSGSLANVVARARHRNLAVSFGVLLLLAASVVMIVVTTQRAQRLARLQMEFIAGVSHELRTPLAVICSAADNLADGVVSARPQMQQYGSLIRTEGRRLAEMIDQILGFATLSRKKYDLKPLDVAGVIEDAVATSARTFRNSSVEISKQIEDGLPPVMADPVSLANCVQNLLSNAMKYGQEGGWIGIRAKANEGERGPEVQISIEDRGPGIEPQDLPHIFDPFYRGASVVAAQIHGAGLGLSLVKQMMEAQGGKVSVKSSPGQGCAFTLHLPAALENGAGAEPAA